MYLKLDKRRQNLQMRDNIMQYAGQTATWRQWISASAGNASIGYGDKPFYRQQTITALFANANQVVGTNTEGQYPGGQFPSGMLMMTTRYPVSYRDEILYNGRRYRIDADSQPSVMNGYFMTTLTRGTTGT
jgi:hypothetical protein